MKVDEGLYDAKAVGSGVGSPGVSRVDNGAGTAKDYNANVGNDDDDKTQQGGERPEANQARGSKGTATLIGDQLEKPSKPDAEDPEWDRIKAELEIIMQEQRHRIMLLVQRFVLSDVARDFGLRKLEEARQRLLEQKWERAAADRARVNGKTKQRLSIKPFFRSDADEATWAREQIEHEMLILDQLRSNQRMKGLFRDDESMVRRYEGTIEHVLETLGWNREDVMRGLDDDGAVGET